MKRIGRYDIVEELGRGAMGVVYKASDPTIGRHVAIKVLPSDVSKEEGAPDPWETFMREARAAGRLSHPSIVTIHDALEDPETGSGCIVMEFVPGRTLESVLLSTPLGVEQSLDIIHQIAEALDYAHRQQVVHRDLKPANILLTEEGRAKIADFGIAKIVAREASLRALPVMGTPSYMSPEQVTGTEVDARSDLFSLGVILYLLLTGQKPFVGDSTAVMFKIAYEDPVAPSRANPKLGAGHDTLVLRCLAKDRKKRYSSAGEFLDDLDDLQHGRPPRSQAKFPAENTPTAEPTLTIGRPVVAPPTAETLDPGKEPAWVVAGVGAGLIVLVTLFGFGVSSSHHRRASDTPPSVPQTTSYRAPARANTLPASPAANAPSLATFPSPPPQQILPNPKGTSSKTEQSSKGGRNRTSTSSTTRTVASTRPAPSRPVQPPSIPPATSSASIGTSHTVQLVCHHQLKRATLMVSTGTQAISQWPLKGMKKGGFLGIKGGYAGTLSRSIKIPAGARELSVHVVSPDGSLDLSQTISATPPAVASPVLQVIVNAEEVTLSWRGDARPPQVP